jgi:hypothetical protein
MAENRAKNGVIFFLLRSILSNLSLFSLICGYLLPQGATGTGLQPRDGRSPRIGNCPVSADALQQDRQGS